MALLFLDSFDHYGADYVTGIEAKWTGGSGSISSGSGRHRNGMTGRAYVAVIPTSGTAIFGAAVRFYVTLVGGIFAIGDVHGLYFGISTLQDGAIRTNMGNRASAVNVLRENQWHYVEMAVSVRVTDQDVGAPGYSTRTVDACKVWVDGALVLDEVDLGTTITQTNGWSAHGWNLAWLGDSGNTTNNDDFYLLDGAGPAPWNAPLGDVQIDVIRPNGATATTQWTPSGAATNFGCVRDQTPDGDATKVIAATGSLSDLYEMENINTGDGIIGAQLLVNARRTEEGFATLAPLVQHAGVVTQLPVRPISPSYFYKNRDILMTMPNGDPLTDANVNALRAGIRRIS